MCRIAHLRNQSHTTRMISRVRWLLGLCRSGPVKNADPAVRVPYLANGVWKLIAQLRNSRARVLPCIHSPLRSTCSPLLFTPALPSLIRHAIIPFIANLYYRDRERPSSKLNNKQCTTIRVRLSGTSMNDFTWQLCNFSLFFWVVLAQSAEPLCTHEASARL